jgi:chaperonin GroES
LLLICADYLPKVVKHPSTQTRFRGQQVQQKGAPYPMTVRPLHDRVLIKRIEEVETLKGGIIIPDSAKEKSQEGEVIAVGTGKTLENGSVAALQVKDGDRILFGKYAGTEIKIEGQDYLILSESEIIGILTSAGKAAGKK